MANEVIISGQTVKYATDRKLLEIVEKLIPADPEEYAHLTSNKKGKAKSCFGMTLLDYSKGKGDNTVSVNVNLTPAQVAWWASACEQMLQTFEMHQEKILSFSAEGGRAPVTKLTVTRNPIAHDGSPARYPWYICAENGMGTVQKNANGGTSIAPRSYTKEAAVFVNLNDSDMHSVLLACRRFMKVWLNTFAIGVIRDGVQLRQQQRQGQNQTYITGQIAKYATDRKLMELTDKLIVASPENYGHLFGDEKGKPKSCIGLTMLDYSAGKGDKTVTVNVNLSDAQLNRWFEAVKLRVPTFEMRQEKILSFSAEGGRAPVTKLTVMRSPVARDGSPARYPWYVCAENGTGAVQKNANGGTSIAPQSYVKESAVFVNLNDEDMFAFLLASQYFIECWLNAFGTVVVRKGAELKQQQRQKAKDAYQAPQQPQYSQPYGQPYNGGYAPAQQQYPAQPYPAQQTYGQPTYAPVPQQQCPTGYVPAAMQAPIGYAPPAPAPNPYQQAPGAPAPSGYKR